MSVYKWEDWLNGINNLGGIKCLEQEILNQVFLKMNCLPK